MWENSVLHIRVLRWVLVVGVALVLGASSSAAAPSDLGDTAASGVLRSFGGRSGATRVKIVVACARPDQDAGARGGWTSALAARIREHVARLEREAKDKKK
jgi:hypothetical protein